MTHNGYFTKIQLIGPLVMFKQWTVKHYTHLSNFISDNTTNSTQHKQKIRSISWYMVK